MRPEHNAQLQDRLLSVGVPAVIAGWLSVSGLRSTAGRSSRLGNTDARSSSGTSCSVEENNVLQFHTDLRSPKVDILKKNKNASLVFYDKEEKIQLRVKVTCEINNKNSILADVLLYNFNKT